MSEEIGSLLAADRILVYGLTGSGKSTVAVRIGEVTGLLVTLVDELPDCRTGSPWTPTPSYS